MNSYRPPLRKVTFLKVATFCGSNKCKSIAQEITHHMEHFFGGGGQGKESERIGNIFIRKLINSQSSRVSSSHPAKQ
jgi:hypothetical protein